MPGGRPGVALDAADRVRAAAGSGLYDSAAAGSGKAVTVTLDAGDYRAGPGTLLANYGLVSGVLSGVVGEITAPATVQTAAGARRTFSIDGGGIRLPAGVQALD